MGRHRQRRRGSTSTRKATYRKLVTIVRQLAESCEPAPNPRRPPTGRARRENAHVRAEVQFRRHAIIIRGERRVGDGRSGPRLRGIAEVARRLLSRARCRAAIDGARYTARVDRPGNRPPFVHPFVRRGCGSSGQRDVRWSFALLLRLSFFSAARTT